MRGSLANFKRHLSVGKKVLFKGFWCPNPTIRTITKVQTNAVAFSSIKHPEKDSWLQFPKADGIIELSPGYFEIPDEFDETGRHSLFYDFREGSLKEKENA